MPISVDDIKILIVGSDANAYYMARCTHEAYNKKAHLIAKQPWFFTDHSKILTIEYHNDLWDESRFVTYINDYANKFKDYKILLVGANDTYTEYISKHQNEFKDNLYFSRHDPKKLACLQDKKLFYSTYADKGLDFPETYYYHIKSEDPLPELIYPIIVKPANVIDYNHIEFEGKKKIFRLWNKDELEDCINKIKNSGYKDDLIIQRYIEGDDSHMFDSVIYVDQNHNVVLQSFAQVGLQDQSADAVGNITLLINGYCSFKNAPVEQTKKALKKFFETEEYSGFADVDLKYDAKTNTFKVLEVNARQGRGSYYVCACGQNLIKVMVDDLILNKKQDFYDLTQEQLLTYVSKNIAKKYILNEDFKNKTLSIWKSGVNPLVYKKDNKLQRKLNLFRNKLRYIKSYKNAYWVSK